MATTAAAQPARPIPILGFYELVLEVADLAASERFYREVLGLRLVERWPPERPAAVLALGRQGFLLLWPPESGGAAAIHNGRGGAHVHFALRVPRGTLDATKARLEARGVPVELYDFDNGNRALYLDDPDGNVVELSEFATLWDGAAAAE